MYVTFSRAKLLAIIKKDKCKKKNRSSCFKKIGQYKL